MTDLSTTLPDAAALTGRDERVRLRTLVMIRWLAVTGQMATLLTVHYGLGFEVPILWCLGVVAASAVFNIVLVMRRPLRARISHSAATVQLGYDIIQLAVLLFLTGGVANPFVLLILSPVTVSATVLPRSDTIALGLLAAIATTVLAIAHLPFPALDQPLLLPDYYRLAVWEALILGTIFIAGYVGSVSEEARRMASAFSAAHLALAREQQLSAVGALAAAAAHELGSPLSTIAVTAREMAREVPRDSELAADVDLLLEQSERCREILGRLGQPVEADALSPMSRMPVGALVESIGRPYVHARPGVDVTFSAATREAGRDDEPVAQRRPEIIQGLATLIQNAVEFAEQRVQVATRWNDGEVWVEIADDGPGFPRGVLERLGEPYISSRAGEDGHMGLGLFIAQTLIEHSGGQLHCRNGAVGGAIVEVRWPRERIEEIMDLDRRPWSGR